MSVASYNAAYLDYPEEEHQARIMCGDPKAMAWCWIHGYAQNLSKEGDADDDYYGGGEVTADELIDTAMNVAEGEYDYISKGPLLDGVSVDPTFWEKLAILKDIEIPTDKRNNFFSCSC